MRFLYLLSIFLLVAQHLVAQVYVMEDGLLIADCNAFFTDPGGLENDYPSSADLETVICSENLTGLTHVRLDFRSLDLLPADTIRFFDGEDSSAPEITLPIDIHAFDNFSVQASAANPSGCLLVQFKSDAKAQAAGWRADINCQMPCQGIDSEITTEQPADEGENTFYFCPGDTAYFSGTALFPQNDILYSQSIENCTFQWKINDQETNFLGQDLALPIAETGLYDLSLEVTDQMGCRNTYEGNARLIVGSYPDLQIDETLLDPVCRGDVLELSTYFDFENPGLGVGIDTIVEQILTSSLQAELLIDPPLGLPDGVGEEYLSVIEVTNSPGDPVVSSTVTLDSVWFFMEHSYSGDLDIEVICPSGVSAYIIEYPNTLGTTNFGEPFASGAVDGESADPTPGVPYRYTVTDHDAPTFSEFDETAPTYTYTTVPSQETGQTFIYSDTYFPAGTYSSQDPFTVFNGCPVNGEWTLRIVDNIGLDNGYMFGWGLAFNGAEQTIIQNRISWQWEDNENIISEEENTIEVLVPNQDELTLTFTANDSYGCVSEVDYQLDILPGNNPTCNSLPSPPVGVDGSPMWPPPSPNPFTTELNLNFADHGPSHVQIYNINGLIVYEDTLEDSYRIDTSSWPVGIYWVRYRQLEGNQMYTTRVIKH